MLRVPLSSWVLVLRKGKGRGSGNISSIQPMASDTDFGITIPAMRQTRVVGRRTENHAARVADPVPPFLPSP